MAGSQRSSCFFKCSLIKFWLLICTPGSKFFYETTNEYESCEEEAGGWFDLKSGVISPCEVKRAGLWPRQSEAFGSFFN